MLTIIRKSFLIIKGLHLIMHGGGWFPEQATGLMNHLLSLGASGNKRHFVPFQPAVLSMLIYYQSKVGATAPITTKG